MPSVRVVGRNRQYRQQTVPPRGGTRVTKARMMRAIKNVVGRTLETDYNDNGANAVSVTAGGAISASQSFITQGLQNGQRKGDRIKVKKLHFKFNLIFGDPTQVFRLILFRWYEDTAAGLPTVGAILQNPLGFAVNSAINHDNQMKGMFHIMYDRTFSMSSTGSTASLSRTLTLYGRRLGRKVIEFNNATTTGNNLFFALYISDSTALPNPTISWYSRIFYTDA